MIREAHDHPGAGFGCPEIKNDNRYTLDVSISGFTAVIQENDIQLNQTYLIPILNRKMDSHPPIAIRSQSSVGLARSKEWFVIRL